MTQLKFMLKNRKIAWIACRLGSSVANAETASSSEVKPKPFSAIPGPRVVPVLKTGWAFLPGIGKYTYHDSDTMNKLYREYGSIIKLEMPTKNTVLVFDPKHIQKVFAAEGKSPIRPGLHALLHYRKSKPDVYPSVGVLLQQGDDWRDLRMKLQKHLMRPSAVRMYLEPLGQIAEDLVHRIRRIKSKDHEVDNFLNELFKWGLESVGLFSLSRRLGCLDDNLAVDSEPQLMIDSANASFAAFHKLESSFEMYRYFPMPAYRKLEKAQTYFESVALKYLNQAFDDLKTKKDGNLDLLNALLSEPGLELKHTVAAVMDMLLAGIDTSAVSSSFIFYELATNPEKQQKLYREICDLMPDKNQLLTKEIFESMNYLHACVREGMRLHPATVGTARILDHDTVLGGYEIPAKTQLGLMLRDASRREDYFKDAQKFIPERWLTSRDELPMPFASMPFGHGPRMCIGRRFAEQEIKLLLIKIIRNFRLEYHYDPMGAIMGTVLLPNKPLRFQFHERK